MKTLAPAKFDETVEAAFRLGVDPRKADQMLRGTVSLPEGHRQERARRGLRAGRRRPAPPRRPAPTSSAPRTSWPGSRAGSWTSTSRSRRPDLMGQVGKLGRSLGPRGLMPNPKTGHGHARRRQGGRGVQGRQGRVPHRPVRQRARPARQGELRRGGARRELLGRARRDPAGEAGVVEGPLPPEREPVVDDGPGREGRPGPRQARGADPGRGPSRVSPSEISRRRPPVAPPGR